MKRAALLALLFFVPGLFAASPTYVRDEVMIPMRDGVRRVLSQ